MSILIMAAAMAGGPPIDDHAAGASDALFRRVEAFVRDEVERERIPGLSVAVVRDSKLVWAKGYGLADLENQVPATEKTIYRFASISRMLTAVAVIQLVERGQLDLKAPIRNYVPELEFDEPIKIEHILAHLSGIRTVNSREELFNRKQYRRLIDTIDSFKSDPLVAKPGVRFHNTPLGYSLLGILMERVEGASFEEALRKNIFEPAEMVTAGVDDPAAIVPHRARGYIRRKDGSLRNSGFVDTSFLRPAEGLSGSVEDLARFASALLDGRLLSEPYRKLMATEYQTSEGKATKYGLGCFVRFYEGRKIIGHAGWQPMVSTFLLMFPEEGLAIAAIANLEQADVKKLCHGVADRMLAAGIGP